MRFRSIGLVTLLGSLPLLTVANPTIRVKGDPPDPTIIVSNNFTFGADSLGGGVLSFEDGSGHAWRDLTVTAVLPEFTPITCGPGPFDICTISTAPQGRDFLYTILFGPSTSGGIANKAIFSINLNDSGDAVDGAGSWGPGTDFGVKANTVGTPEPSATLLLIIGFMSFAGWRRSQRRATSE